MKTKTAIKRTLLTFSMICALILLLLSCSTKDCTLPQMQVTKLTEQKKQIKIEMDTLLNRIQKIDTSDPANWGDYFILTDELEYDAIQLSDINDQIAIVKNNNKECF